MFRRHVCVAVVFAKSLTDRGASESSCSLRESIAVGRRTQTTKFPKTYSTLQYGRTSSFPKTYSYNLVAILVDLKSEAIMFTYFLVESLSKKFTAQVLNQKV